MEFPVIFAHGGSLLVGIPAVIAAGFCLLVAGCLKFFQTEKESPKARRWLAVLGFLFLVVAFFSDPLSSIIFALAPS